MRRLLRWMGRIFLLWAVYRIAGPEARPRFDPPQIRPLKIPGRTVFVGEREFFVRETGPEDGPPVVLVHGWSLSSEAVFHALVPLLAPDHRVVMVDLRNHGKSDRIRERYHVEDLADDVAGVLTVLRAPPAVVFGYSLGGMVAQTLAIRHPGIVSGLVLGATAAHPVPRNRMLVRSLLWPLRALARVFAADGGIVVVRVMVRFGAVRPEHAAAFWNEIMGHDWGLFFDAGAAAWWHDTRSELPRLDVPSAVVITIDDFVVPADAQYELASLLRGARVVEVVDVGHEAVTTRPEPFAAAVRDVVGALQSGATG